MKYTKIFFILLLIFVAACNTQSIQTRTAPSAQVDSQKNVVSEHLKEFNVEAFQFGYEPAEIRVKQDDTVNIKLTTRDVAHSLMIKDYEINIKTSPNVTGEATFVADKVGSFEWNCRIPCGTGHNEMDGVFIVE